MLSLVAINHNSRDQRGQGPMGLNTNTTSHFTAWNYGSPDNDNGFCIHKKSCTMALCEPEHKTVTTPLKRLVELQNLQGKSSDETLDAG